MNRRPSGSLPLTKAISGFLQYKAAEGLSPNTLTNYQQDLKRWMAHQGDIDIGRVESKQIRDFFVWLRTDYQPHRFSGGTQPLAAKTIHNSYIALSSFFTWASTELELASPMKAVPAPHFQVAPVEAFSKEDIEALLKASEFCKEALPTNRRRFTMKRWTAHRDQAIILTLLDTGLRASELSALTVGDVELKTGKVQVKHGRLGGAKGGKGRIVFLGKAARRAVWRYLAEREDGTQPEAPLFLVKCDRPMNRTALRFLIKHLGTKAGVKNCHPHRFRHTFAITYLRSGGDVFTLQALLGHSTLDMVQRYTRVAEIDIEQVHRRASPVDNWRL